MTENFWQLRHHNSCAYAISFLELLHQSRTPALDSCQTDPTVSSFLPLPCPPTTIWMPRAAPRCLCSQLKKTLHGSGRVFHSIASCQSKRTHTITFGMFRGLDERKDVEKKTNEPRRDHAPPKRTENSCVRT